MYLYFYWHCICTKHCISIMTCSTSLSCTIKDLQNVNKFCPILFYLPSHNIHIPSCNGPLVTAVKSDKCENCKGAILLFYILQKIILTKDAYISKVYYSATLYDPTLSSGSVAPTSQVHTSRLLLTVRN
jgi:hypothetical protein